MFNLRKSFLCAIGLIMGIALYYCIIESINTKSFNVLIVAIGLIIISLIGLLIVLFIKSKIKKVSCYSAHYLCVIMCLIFVVLGVCLSAVYLQPNLSLPKYSDTVNISGTISSCSSYQKSTAKVVIEDIKLNNEYINSNMVMFVYLPNGESVSLNSGDVITTTAKVTLTPLFGSNSNISTYVNGNPYSCVVNAQDVSVTSSSSVRLSQQIRSAIKKSLDSNLNSDNSSIANALLFGDKTGLSDEVKSAFSFAGISHILAVSGLHVSFLVAIILMLLKLFKANRYVKMCVTSIVLLFYCYICGFPISVVRATIMTIIMLGAKVLGKEYDALSSLSIACIIVLIINPLQLFDIGFQLSFLCVLSVITLCPYIVALFQKIKCPKIIANILGISISCNVVLFSLCANYFSQVSILGILSNIIVIPILSILFPLLFVLSIVSLIPHFGFVLTLPNILLHVIKWIAELFSNLSFGVFKVFRISYLVVFGIIITLLITRFMLSSHLVKSITISVLIVSCVTGFMVCLIPSKYTNAITLSYEYTDSTAIISDSSGENYMVGVTDYYYNTLKSLKINKLKGIVAYNYSTSNLDTLISMCNDYNVPKVYLPINYSSMIETKILLNTKVTNCYFVNNFTIDDYHINYVYNSLDYVVGLQAIKNDTHYIFAMPSITKNDFITLVSGVDKIDYLIVNSLNIDYSNYISNNPIVIYHNNLKYKQSNDISINYVYSFTI